METFRAKITPPEIGLLLALDSSIVEHPKPMNSKTFTPVTGQLMATLFLQSLAFALEKHVTICNLLHQYKHLALPSQKETQINRQLSQPLEFRCLSNRLRETSAHLLNGLV